MKKTLAALAVTVALAGPLRAVVQHAEGWKDPGRTVTFTADRVAYDRSNQGAFATGHVHAVSEPFTLRGESMVRAADGTMHFAPGTCATTCSNAVGHTHWNATGEIVYRANDFVLLRDAWLTLYEMPIFWMPYMYYPLDTKCGFSWMPGYTGRWGAYLLTRYRYHIAGDPEHADNTYWLRGDTRLDLRTENGVAFGEGLKWNLGDFGHGAFKAYYAWDRDTDRYHHREGTNRGLSRNWESDVDEDRYGFEISHFWDVTERDIVRARGGYYSDSQFRDDFYRRSFFNPKNQFVGYDISQIVWEHVENVWSVGAEIGGRLNDFYDATERLPEVYFDVAPQPIFATGINYESENRLGYLRRRAGRTDAADDSVFRYRPGIWADYEAARFDTYHRLTLPFRMCSDVLSVVPRLGYRGTFWDESGVASLDGREPATEEGDLFRSIAEGGVTFAARGTAWVDDVWQHLVEPYADVLCQEAEYAKDGDGKRPYVFDNLDASRTWEDQYAGRGRNLPYDYYGVTPGLRNAWSKLDEHGNLHQILELDVYAACQFNDSDILETEEDLDSRSHSLADLGSPNYDAGVVPGARLRWRPADDITLSARAEYDSDGDTLALADFAFRQHVSEAFSYYADYRRRNVRYWDFSSSPYDAEEVKNDDLNWARFENAEFGFTHQPVEWLAFSPFVRWDMREDELDCVGCWVDYLTDCLGFRFIVGYENDYERLDGYKYDDDWSFGFQIYLRAFGDGLDSVFH